MDMQNRKNQKNQNQKGFTLNQKGFTFIEMAVVLAVLAVLIAGTVQLTSNLGKDAEIKLLKDAVYQINTRVIRFASGAGQYGTGNLNNVLIAAKQVPGTLKVTGTNIIHPVGGNDGQIIVEGRGSLFAITVTGLNKEDCINFLTGLDGFKRVFIDNSSTAPSNVVTGGTESPITQITAVSLCTANTGNAVHLVN